MTTSVAPVSITGASFFSTHYASAADAVAHRERASTAPTYGLLVGRARRFTSLATQMHVEAIGALAIDPANPPASVFATLHGEIQTAEMLIADFHKSALVSSARFALSVHNTPSGVYTVATSSNAPSTTVTGANAIAAGWLDAVLTALDAGRTVLLSIADEPVPPVFKPAREHVGVAAAFLIAPASQPGRRAQLAITPRATTGDIDPVQVLARAADAALHDEPATIDLGWIQAGAMLELQVNGGRGE